LCLFRSFLNEEAQARKLPEGVQKKKWRVATEVRDSLFKSPPGVMVVQKFNNPGANPSS
jgi:hypothetical protein